MRYHVAVPGLGYLGSGIDLRDCEKDRGSFGVFRGR
jgi:hypothetical protein